MYLKFRTVITWSFRPWQNPGKNTSSSTILLNVFPNANIKTMKDFSYLLIRLYVDFFSIFGGLFYS